MEELKLDHIGLGQKSGEDRNNTDKRQNTTTTPHLSVSTEPPGCPVSVFCSVFPPEEAFLKGKDLHLGPYNARVPGWVDSRLVTDLLGNWQHLSLIAAPVFFREISLQR